MEVGFYYEQVAGKPLDNVSVSQTNNQYPSGAPAIVGVIFRCDRPGNIPVIRTTAHRTIETLDEEINRILQRIYPN